jgi:short subunit fatty acids transporter
MLIGILIVIILAAVGYGVLTMPDKRGVGQKVDDAVDALPHGVDKAARQLEDRTPGEKLGDAVKDTGDKIKDSTKND